jgi:hypothetical protein
LFLSGIILLRSREKFEIQRPEDRIELLFQEPSTEISAQNSKYVFGGLF